MAPRSLRPSENTTPRAIDALAAYDISDVIGRIAERLGDREPPVLIINGRKVADPSIFTRFPPDTILMIEQARRSLTSNATFMWVTACRIAAPYRF